jgi:hypothetical protein
VSFQTIIEDTNWFAYPEGQHISQDRASQKSARFADFPPYNATSHAFGVIEAEIAERDPFGDVNQVKPRRGGGVRDTTYENRR